MRIYKSVNGSSLNMNKNGFFFFLNFQRCFFKVLLSTYQMFNLSPVFVVSKDTPVGKIINQDDSCPHLGPLVSIVKRILILGILFSEVFSVASSQTRLPRQSQIEMRVSLSKDLWDETGKKNLDEQWTSTASVGNMINQDDPCTHGPLVSLVKGY